MATSIKWYTDEQGNRHPYFVDDVTGVEEPVFPPGKTLQYDEQGTPRYEDVPHEPARITVSPRREVVEPTRDEPGFPESVSDVVVPNADRPATEPVTGPDYENIIPQSYERAVAERAKRQQENLANRRAGQQAQQEQEPDPVVSAIARAIEPEKQAAAGFIGTTLGTPWDIGGLLTKLGPLMLDRTARSDAVADNQLPPDQRPATNPISDFLFQQGASARRGANTLVGADPDPSHPINRAMRIVGSSVSPFGKNPVAASAIVGGVNTGADVVKQVFEKPSIDSFKKSPPQWLHDALFSPARGDTPTADPNDPTRLISPSPFDQKTVPINTVSGLGQITKGEYMTIGGIAAGTAGMIFGPRIFRNFSTGRLPAFRRVQNAAPGTQAISTPIDLARTYDDVNAGALRLMRRAGIDPAAVARVEQVMRIQTRATANGMIDSAIKGGRMNTPNYTFQVRVPLSELQAQETQATRDYLHILDTWDEIRRNSNAPLSRRTAQRINRSNAPVRGHDIISVTNARNALERTNPEVIPYARAYRENLRAMRRFEADGEYATLSRGRARQLNAEFPNEVPFRGPRTNDPTFDRGSPIVALAERMRELMRARMENEAKGMYVDAIRGRAGIGPTRAQALFVPVTPEELAQNGNWRANTLTFRRRGEVEHYTTDPFIADVMRMDPYHIVGYGGQVLHATKRLFEMTTTGALAPQFAPVSFFRNWWLGKVSPDPGMRSPTLHGSLAAIPRQLYPQLAQTVHAALDRGSAGWLNSVFGTANMQALSQRLGYHYERSLWAQLEAAGGGRGAAFTEQQFNANNRLTQAIQENAGSVRTFLEGYKALLNSIHNAPSFNYAVRNQGQGIPAFELARRARALTGDPRIGGEFFTNVPGRNHATPIRFDNVESRVSHTAGRVVQGYGGATELGRTVVPWYNATTQGVKRLGEAYLADPVRFTGRTWLYQIAPAASMYLAARALGNDPNGVSYLDYMMNRRSEYNKMMNFYIPIPGKPAEQGIEMPSFHEGSIARYLTTIGLDHAYGSNFFTEKEDLLRAAQGITGVVFEPAMPPILNLPLASMGMTPMQGVFSGESYHKKPEPFDQHGSGMATSTEAYMRALGAGLADLIGNGYAAYSQPGQTVAEGVGAGAKATGQRMAQKTPILRDMLDLQQPMTGNNAITAELFRKSKSIKALDTFYKQWTVNVGLIGSKPRSKGGEALAAEQLGERPPSEPAGIGQPVPTNPLYNMFIEEMHKKFVTDSPTDRRGRPTGAIGFPSLWNRYRIASAQIDRLRKVNPGNDAIWKEQVDGRPKQTEYLKKNKIDPYNPTMVRNFYERQRQDAARILLKTIRDVEDDFSKRVGKPVKLEDLDPYGRGLEGEEDFSPVDASGVLE